MISGLNASRFGMHACTHAREALRGGLRLDIRPGVTSLYFPRVTLKGMATKSSSESLVKAVLPRSDGLIIVRRAPRSGFRWLCVNPFYMAAHNYYHRALDGAPVLQKGEGGRPTDRTGRQTARILRDLMNVKKHRRERKPAISASKARTFTRRVSCAPRCYCSHAALVAHVSAQLYKSGIRRARKY